jgi:hypothetical protein
VARQVKGDYIKIMSNNKSVYDKIKDGDYTSKLPYPKGFRANWTSKDEDMRRAYKEDADRLDEQFKIDALQELGVAGHPKAQKLYLLAYEHGHAGGYSDIWTYMNDFADLVKD